MPFQHDLKLARAVETSVLAMMIKENDLWSLAVPSTGLDKGADIRLNVSAEIKYDRRASETGNLAIEVACAGKPSGITATTADIWITVLLGEYDGVYSTPVPDLRYLVQGRPVIRGGDRNASEMVLLKITEFLPLARRMGPAPAFLKMQRV